MAIEYPIALRKVSEDGRYRLTVHYDNCAMHPLNSCDFPLHMDDWHREYSARPGKGFLRKEDEQHYWSSEACMQMLLRYYGDYKKVIDVLVSNGKEQTHGSYDCALVYDRSEREWVLMDWVTAYRNYSGERIEAHWDEIERYDCTRETMWKCESVFFDIIERLTEECLADLLKCLTDECKVMSYGFGYHGSMCFYSNVDSDCEGIAWIVKSEAVGDGKWLTEEQWRTQDCYELTKGEREEIEAWAEGNVFWFEVEKNVLWKVHRECLSEEREAEDYEEEEWEQVDSCGGFYGLDYAVDYAIETNKLPKMIEAA